PLDNPADDHTPHPTGFPDPDSGPEGFVDPVLVEMDGFNQFQDPWLPDGATQTIGNNASAYVDHDDVDGINDADFYGEVTQPGVFDWVYDVYADPIADQTQSMASIVQIFYTVNWLHDYWYDSGFDEEAGNAQEDNYGRGGAEGDSLKLEAQNSALSGPVNNANMSTPADGMQPRMQMYLYNGLKHSELTIEPLAETFDVGTANFGPTSFDLTAEITLVDDGVETATDGCEPIVNNIVGKIALIDRGSCSFETKVTHAEEAGALGVLIANNDPDTGAMTLGTDADLEDPTLPALGISMASGDMLKQALLLETQTAHMLLETDINRDGTLENMVVAHEWGHYLHNRLTDCSNQLCRAQGEGWGDFLTLHTVLREGDNLDGTYGRPIYTRSEPSGYFGNRRVAYSVDPTKNTLSFRHISDGEPLPDDIPLNPKTQPNSEVHRAGEVWTSMLFEAY
ncbi:MAG: M36 family metallopeptidase, partial [Nannocystaceae bacterium]